MYVKTRVAVICQGSADLKVCRLALAVTAGAWDAGAEVRVRLVGPVSPPDDARSSPEWAEVLCESEGIPEASPDDLEWADVVLFGTPTRDGTVVGELKHFIDATIPLWKDGKLAGKVYGVFTGAAAHPLGRGTRMLSLADVFAFWGGVIVPAAGRGAIQLRGDADESSSAAMTQTPTEAELAAARDQGRQAAVTGHALKAARRALADVA
jgi:NAD(P)H dehydrogenase (quinone)